VDWETAVVAIVVAVIGIAGVYVGTRLQARTGLAQWRRERLLEFCADLLAAGRQLMDTGWEIEAKHGDVMYPIESTQQLGHAYACVTLLSDELNDSAHELVMAHMDLVRRAYAKAGDPQQPSPDVDAASRSAGRFARAARDVIMDFPSGPVAPWESWSRNRGRPKAEATAKS
jgi:hypothetical protein